MGGQGRGGVDGGGRGCYFGVVIFPGVHFGVRQVSIFPGVRFGVRQAS